MPARPVSRHQIRAKCSQQQGAEVRAGAGPAGAGLFFSEAEPKTESLEHFTRIQRHCLNQFASLEPEPEAELFTLSRLLIPASYTYTFQCHHFNALPY